MFTGEDVVELHCHGDLVVTGVTDALLMEVPGLAEPGEFTQRGFFGGENGFSTDGSTRGLITDTSTQRSQAKLGWKAVRDLRRLEVHVDWGSRTPKQSLILE
jgi:tRNA U34 5-carboxymethylaminomethyl modifying GTPase MnmE/TrmE